MEQEKSEVYEEVLNFEREIRQLRTSLKMWHGITIETPELEHRLQREETAAKKTAKRMERHHLRPMLPLCSLCSI